LIFFRQLQREGPNQAQPAASETPALPGHLSYGESAEKAKIPFQENKEARFSNTGN